MLTLHLQTMYGEVVYHPWQDHGTQCSSHCGSPRHTHQISSQVVQCSLRNSDESFPLPNYQTRFLMRLGHNTTHEPLDETRPISLLIFVHKEGSRSLSFKFELQFLFALIKLCVSKKLWMYSLLLWILFDHCLSCSCFDLVSTSTSKLR